VTRPDLILHQGDFAETLAKARDMGGVDLILTSPPYCDARTSGAGVNWTLPDYQRLGDAVKPALKPGGHCLMVLDAPVREWRPGYGTERGFMPWIVMLDWAERVGLRVPDRLAMARLGLPGAYSGRFRNDWEPLLWFQSPGDGWFDKASLSAAGKSGSYSGGVAASRRDDGDRNRRRISGTAAADGLITRGTLWDYWHVGSGADGDADEIDHHARFSVAFAEDAVRCFCPPGGWVCDPFVGSGTSAVAAIRHGRKFIGGDLLTRPQDGMPWIEVARRRVERDGPVAPQAVGHGPLFGGAR